MHGAANVPQPQDDNAQPKSNSFFHPGSAAGKVAGVVGGAASSAYGYGKDKYQ